MIVNENLLFGIVAMLGALGYNLWGFLHALQKTRETPEVEEWDVVMTLMTIIPSLVAGFLAGYKISPSGAEYVLVFCAGYAAGDIGNKLGINSFFRQKKVSA